MNLNQVDLNLQLVNVPIYLHLFGIVEIEAHEEGDALQCEY